MSLLARTPMEFDADNGSKHGKFFEGAIFMSNHATKKECFQRKLFGLPPSQAPFVKKVKAGMALFLFEYEERKLHGVFEASSDGAMNIVPHAYSSSGKPLSAQVRFKRLWLCHPLSEDEFYDAIKDNYYTSNKFNFGLYKEQVRKLIWLFNEKKIKPKISGSLASGNSSKIHSENPSVGRIKVTVERSVSSDTDSSEDDYSVDNERELVRLNRYSNLPKPNLSLSNYCNDQADDSELENQRAFPMTVPWYYKKQVLNTEDPTLEREHGSSLIFSRVTPLTSQQDASIKGNFMAPHLFPDFKSQPTSYPESSFCLKSDPTQELRADSRRIQGYPLSESSFCLKSDPIQELRADSRMIQGHPYPFSRTQQYPYHIDAEKLDTRYHSTKDDDLFPSEPQVKGHEPYIPCSRTQPFRSKSIDMNLSSNSEDDSSYFPLVMPAQDYEPSSLILPYLGADKFKASSCWECSQGKCLVHKHGYSKPATSQHGDGYKVQGFPQTKRLVEWDPPSSECTFQSDQCKKRVSVFSRLSAPETSDQDDENEMEISVNDDMDISASKLLGVLAMRRKQRMMMKKARRTLIIQDDDHASEAHQEMSGIALGDEDNLWDGSDIVEGRVERPFLNFGRRSKIQRTGNEMGVSVNTGEDEDSSGKLKRRKLIRPSFGDKKSIDEVNIYDSKTKLLSEEHVTDHGSNSIAEVDRNAKGCSEETNVEHAFLSVSGCEDKKKVIGSGFEQTDSLFSNDEDNAYEIVGIVHALGKANVEQTALFVSGGEEEKIVEGSV